MVSRGKVRGDICRTNGAWLVTKHDDGTTTREALLTFNPFARRWLHQGSDGPRDLDGAAAWARERARCRRAEVARRAVAGGGAGR